jgi:hypothetical protein
MSSHWQYMMCYRWRYYMSHDSQYTRCAMVTVADCFYCYRYWYSCTAAVTAIATDTTACCSELLVQQGCVIQQCMCARSALRNQVLLLHSATYCCWRSLLNPLIDYYGWSASRTEALSIIYAYYYCFHHPGVVVTLLCTPDATHISLPHLVTISSN